MDLEWGFNLEIFHRIWTNGNQFFDLGVWEGRGYLDTINA